MPYSDPERQKAAKRDWARKNRVKLREYYQKNREYILKTARECYQRKKENQKITEIALFLTLRRLNKNAIC